MFNYSRLVLISMVRFYQVLLSPWLGGQCRFYPSCSTFAAEAIRLLPLRRAMPEVIGRLVRCHPFHPGGFHPVPHS